MEDVWVILIISFLSGSTTVIGALLAMFLKEKKNYVSIGVGFSSGIMIAISFLELLATALTMMDELFIVFAFALGFVLVLIIDVSLPHMHLIEEVGPSRHLIKISYLVAIGIIIHDFPEGFAMASSFWVEVRLGLLVALGIALHNVPEEFALAVPLVLTRKTKLLLEFLVLSALAEPFGAILGLLCLRLYLSSTRFCWLSRRVQWFLFPWMNLFLWRTNTMECITSRLDLLLESRLSWSYRPSSKSAFTRKFLKNFYF